MTNIIPDSNITLDTILKDFEEKEVEDAYNEIKENY